MMSWWTRLRAGLNPDAGRVCLLCGVRHEGMNWTKPQLLVWLGDGGLHVTASLVFITTLVVGLVLVGWDYGLVYWQGTQVLIWGIPALVFRWKVRKRLADRLVEQIINGYDRSSMCVQLEQWKKEGGVGHV